MKKNYLSKINSLTLFNFRVKATTFFTVVLVLFLLGFQNTFSQTVTYTTGSGNFTVPCDVTSITVKIWGGGGAGGGGNNNNNGGSGGGAGGYSTSTLAVTGGSTIAFSVGVGGTGNNNTGNPGGVTTFGASTANGGSGGGPNQGAIGIGGTASAGTTNTSGNNGSLGTSTIGGAGGNANGGGGSGGASRNTAGVGNIGIAPGGGGGGGFRTTATNRAGGAGGAGEIRITYTSSFFTYCSPTFTSNVEPITNVTFAGINNTTTNATGGNALESFCNTANVTQGQTVPISVKGNTGGNFTHYFRLYVDWNKNGTFGDLANELYDLGTITNSTGIDAIVLNTTITVPALASLGLTRMRLMKRYNTYPTGACQTGAGWGQAEDYCVNVIAPPTITSLSATSGCVGSSLTITGTNLSGATAATIGGTAATITANTATSVTVTVGSGTTGTVSITSPGGTASSVASFTVNPLPAAIAGATTVCIGGTATVTNATAGGTWGIANGTGSATITASGVVTGLTAGTVTVSYTLPTTCNVIATVTVQQPAGAIAGGASTVCENSSTPAFTNPVAGGTWTVTNGTGTATITSPGGVLTGTSAGTVTVNYTIGSCTAATYAVTVNPTPVAITGAATLCIGATTTLTDATAGGTWGIVNGTGSASITATGNVTGLTAGTVTASYTLSPTTCNVTKSLTVQQAPGAIAGGASSICVGSATPPFTNPVAGGAWTVTNGTGTATITSPAGVLTGTGAGTVTVNYTIGSCTAVTYSVTVNPTPVAIVGAATVCTGATTTLTDATAGGTWGITNGTGSATITAGGVVSAVTAGTVTASYTLSPTTCNVTRSITVQQTPGAIAGGASSVCVGSSTPAFTNPNAGGTWTVTNGTGTATITSPAGILTGTAAGTVIVRYTIGTCTAATYAVTVNPTPSTPTAPVNSAITGSGFTVTWTASAGAVNYVLEVYTNAGYTIPVAGSPFTVSSPTVNYSVTGLTGPVTYYYRIKATNTNCSSGYVTGIVTTLISNDECTGAIPLTVSTTCSYSTYTNAGATGSIGITAPGCASYNGGDVWFLAVVPATGELNIDLTQGVMTDSGLAIYSGSCGSLTLLDCDDDSSIGTMSRLSRTGLTPGQTIYIRVWEFGNNNNGTFGICVTTPSCPSPSDLYTNILSTTSVTVNWNASAPPASGGYQYFINTTGTAPTTGTTPTGTTAAGVTGVTFNGLTPGLKYYFWIRSFCGGSDVSSWFGPTNYTPCAVGSGTGTTTLGCTSPIAGGLGLSGSDPVALTCSALTCPTLEVSYLPIKQTTDYTVTSILPYAPPYQFTCLQNPVSVNVDDVWSPIIDLPFDFCFYGNSFDKCLIGSNGVITFDTTNNTPGGYSAWSFDTNLPNASLFRNTIFGVYHDMDPSSGGQVGWELITLNTGCRALVAAWNEIPMYSSACNSMFFTGMMVLYENTNIIEVYIQEKNVCSTWNDGNAIVGVQNSTGTAAVVAPARNGLNTNWTVTNEAWRFTPNGPSINPTVQWYQGSVATGTPISGATSSSVTVCPTVSTSYTAEVTYPLCTGDFKVTDQVAVTVNGNKIWNGNTSNDWNTNSNWTPSGVPTAANCVVIPVVNSPKPYPVISNTADGVGYNLAVYNNASLTINSNQNLTITDAVTVQTGGLFTINNSASLIQINNVLNSGNITYRRESPSVRTLDYSYWSSPVANFNVSNIVLPYTFGLIYKWNTTVANANGTQGNWQWAAGNTMIPGKGYIARAPSAAPFNNTTTNILYGTFTGVPNNGTITFPIERGSDQNTLPHTGTNGVAVSNYSDNWNLLGNPYPSAMSGGRFLYDNRTKIEGNIRLWTHGQLPTNPTNPFYGTFLYNYFGADYLEYNYTGMSCCPSAANDLYIGAGQGFFVQMVDGPQSIGVESVTFTNNLRSVEFDNSTFFKTPNLTTDTPFDVNDIERNRIWLDIVNSTNQSHRTLFGYIENATMGKDSFYDCATQITNGPLIYSLINDDLFSIQGRSLPFEINDEVPIGVNIPTQGNYSIAIAGTDGLFASQDIYLKDNLLNITHDLKISPYQFTPEPGVINNRFKVVYINNALATNNPNEITTYTTISNNTIVVESNDFIKAIDLYDVTGKHVNRYSLTEIKKQFSDVFNYPNGVYIVKITFDNDMVVSKKLLH